MAKKTFFTKKVLAGGLVVLVLLMTGAYIIGSDGLQGRFSFGPRISPLSPLSPLSSARHLKPDLAITDIYMDDEGKMTIVQENLHNRAVTPTDGHTFVYIDGAIEWTYSWTTLSETGFLDEWGNSLLQPQMTEVGVLVEACIDPNDVVDESDETNNCWEELIDEEVTRGSFSSDVVEAMGIGLDTCTGVFVDVPTDHEYCGAIEALYNDGLIDGYADSDGYGTGTFGVDDLVNRAAAAKIIVLAFLGESAIDSTYDAGFTDVDPADWYSDYVNTAHLYGIVTGYLDSSGTPTGLFGPGDTLFQTYLDTWLVNASGGTYTP